MKIHNSEIFKITIYDFNPSYLEKPLQTSYTSPSGAKVLVLQKRNLKFENLIRKKNRFKKDVALSILISRYFDTHFAKCTPKMVKKKMRSP